MHVWKAIIYVPHPWSVWGLSQSEQWESESHSRLVSPAGCNQSSGLCTVCAGVSLEEKLKKRNAVSLIFCQLMLPNSHLYSHPPAQTFLWTELNEYFPLNHIVNLMVALEEMSGDQSDIILWGTSMSNLSNNCRDIPGLKWWTDRHCVEFLAQYHTSSHLLSCLMLQVPITTPAPPYTPCWSPFRHWVLLIHLQHGLCRL